MSALISPTKLDRLHFEATAGRTQWPSAGTGGDQWSESDSSSSATSSPSRPGALYSATPDQARHALDSLEKIAGNLREEDVGRAGSDAAPEQQAAAIEAAEDVPAAAKPASVIATAAVQSAAAGLGGKPIIDESVTLALGGGGTAGGHASGPPPLEPGTVSAARSAAGSGCFRFRGDQSDAAYAVAGSLHDSPELGDDGWQRLAPVPAARNARGSSARVESDASRGACPVAGHRDC
jgi:hypothetical protein